MEVKIFALILFIATYVLMIAKQNIRPWVALSSALIFIVSGIVPLKE